MVMAAVYKKREGWATEEVRNLRSDPKDHLRRLGEAEHPRQGQVVADFEAARGSPVELP
jgi:hypothetical protein